MLWVVLASLTTGCLSPLRMEEGAAHVDEYQGVRIVEVLASPVGGASQGFVELRNDGDAEVSLAGWGVRFGASGAGVTLKPRQVEESAEAYRNVDPNLVPAHSLALIVDPGMDAQKVGQLACEAPIAPVSFPASTELTQKQRNILTTTLQLQQRRHCIPVFTLDHADGIGVQVARAADISLVQGSNRKDRARGAWADAAAGVALERTGAGEADFAPSPIGSTPGTRNFFSSDPYRLAHPDAPLPLEVHNASPWRTGNELQRLRREANAKLAAGDTAGAEALFAQVRQNQCEEFTSAPDNTRCKAELSEHMVANPLVADFNSFIGLADDEIVGSFYQINQHEIVDALVGAAGQGVDIRLSTDAGFENDPHYLPGFAKFHQAGIGLVYDSAYGIHAGDRVELAFEVITGEEVDDRGTSSTSDDIRLELASAMVGSWVQPAMGVGERRSLQQLGIQFTGETRQIERGAVRTADSEPSGGPANCTFAADKIWVTADGHVVADSESVHGYKRIRVRDSAPDNTFEIQRAIDPMANSFDADRSPLSHNKFLVADGEWLWTGSFNPIEDEPSSVHSDQAVTIHSTELARIHQTEAAVLFAGQPGIIKRDADTGVGGGEAWVDGAQVEVRFSPGLTAAQLERRGDAIATGADGCSVQKGNGVYIIGNRYRNLDPCGGPTDLLSAEVARAQSSIYFGFFSFALDSVTHVMLDRMRDGVDIRGVGDQTLATRGPMTLLANAGADVRFTPNSDPDSDITPARFRPSNVNKIWYHHKFVVIDYGTDHPVVITGSHNMSDSAEDQNDEALIVIRDRAVAEQYYRIFRDSYDHPQALGPHRDTTGLPALAITEVRGSADPTGPQFAEITNVGQETASLGGLEIWNRFTAVELQGSNLVLEPGERAVFVVGDDTGLGIPDNALTITTDPDQDRPFIGLGTAIVLRTADGRWVSSYDPYTAAQNVPAGASAPTPGGAMEWNGFGAQELSALTLELLGRKNTEDEQDRFSWSVWQPRGMFSEWLDEHDVTPNALVLMQGAASPWTPSADPAGTPGRDASAAAAGN